MAEQLTHAALYDLLQEWFGLGEYDALVEKQPWYKARMNEIGKLKRLMNSRRVDVASVLQAAQYAHHHHVPITATWELLELIPEARRAARAESQESLSDRIQTAVQQALAADEEYWAHRLASASSQDALDAWEAHRG